MSGGYALSKQTEANWRNRIITAACEAIINSETGVPLPFAFDLRAETSEETEIRLMLITLSKAE